MKCVYWRAGVRKLPIYKKMKSVLVHVFKKNLLHVQPLFSVQKTVILYLKIDQTVRGIFLVFCGVQKLPWPKKQAYVLPGNSSNEQPG